jgi:hypothetical protein
LEQTVEQFVVRQSEKAEKANKKAAIQLSKESTRKAPANQAMKSGARNRGDFVKYFSSSESESES